MPPCQLVRVMMKHAEARYYDGLGMEQDSYHYYN